MKEINPVSIWYNGSAQNATLLQSYCINDNLSTQAIFYYSLYSANSDGTPNNQLTSGNLTMTGADYTAYETNQYAYTWIATQLNISYVTPPTK
jgi:hypothetical protein